MWLPWKGRECWELQMASQSSAMNPEHLTFPGGMFAPRLRIDLGDAMGMAGPIIGLWAVRDATQKLDGLQGGEQKRSVTSGKQQLKHQRGGFLSPKDTLGFAEAIGKDAARPRGSSQLELKQDFILLLGYKGIVKARRDVAAIQLRNGNLDETVAASLSPPCNSTQMPAAQPRAWDSRRSLCWFSHVLLFW